ncbi:DUF6544 family protein [Saccharicrinis sp. FJH2]|uniref:DUF6544 family protein n=1 Tax=Saccharicrinis sp. FJH65 TaxID=3344659 RepID=UPI0035F4CD8C
MKKVYKSEVTEGLKCTNGIKPEIIAENDLAHLPSVVKKCLKLAGVVGKEKIVNVRFNCKGRIRSKPGDSWMNFKSEQYDFFDPPRRVFYIKAHKMGIPATGIHLYKNVEASMVVKIAGLFKVVDAKGPEMNQGETVTVFNDMCLIAPATLIDKRIEWETIDPLSVRANYKNGDIQISATLQFNESGELINFISNDRFETADGKTYMNYPWSTPFAEYKDFNGNRVGTKASTIYHKPDSDFCYGEFELTEVEYNCKEL